MVRFIAHLLVVSLVTLNIASEVDACTFTDPGRGDAVLVQLDDQSPDSPNAGLDCDDWCQGWVNPVALPGAIIQDGYMPVTVNGGSYTLSYSSLPIPPPFHPPIA